MVRLFTGFEAYLVGGCVRDLLLNRPPKDFNVITIRSPALRRWRKILKKKKNFSYLKCLEAVTSLTLISGKTLCIVTSLLTGILSTNISTCSCVIHRGLCKNSSRTENCARLGLSLFSKDIESAIHKHASSILSLRTVQFF
ncbi:putative polynucleotide adenylyltransferase [Helianthus annuus]|uniref:Polynucleotide adenylyltransferase n=1 Tax=Helianthus annuus TaxID=4232 RepID=A0A9K3H361_HELAN|nr:putative polynucleotide adenylyltransferase [Helianthus annuus]KAJ0832389.1 putative polynucleotide adenylyltransferase [Helianthus annuus]